MERFLMPPDEPRNETPKPDAAPQTAPFLMPPDYKANALSNLRSMAGTSPEQAVADIKLGNDLNIPPDMVGMNRLDAQRMKVEQEIKQVNSPLLDEWMAQNQYNTLMGAGDARGLADVIESTGLVGIGKSALKTAGRLPGIAGEAVYGTVGLGFGALDYMEQKSAQVAKFIGLNEGQRTGWFGMARDWAQKNADTIRREYLESDILSLPEELQSSLWENPGYLLDPEYLSFQLGDAANSLVVMLAGGAGYSLVRGGAFTAQALTKTGPVAGGLMEAAPVYNDLLKEGINNERALSGAMAFGVVVGLLEKSGLDKILEGPGGKGLLRGVRDFFIAGSREAVTEYAEEPAQAILSGLARGDSGEQILEDFFDSLTNIDVIPGAFLLGGGAHRISQHVQRAQEADAYSKGLMNLYEKVEAADLKELSPAHMQNLLEFASPEMREQVALPADAALELYQQGVDVLSPLGLSEQEARMAAAKGQDLLVTAAKLPAYLDRQQMEAASQIIRRAPEAMSAEEAARVDAQIEEDAAKLAELYQGQAEELDAFERGLEELRNEAMAAINNSPGLKAQAEALGGVEQYASDWLNTVRRFALRMSAATGQSPLTTVQRVFFNQGRLQQAQHGQGNIINVFDQVLYQETDDGGQNLVLGEITQDMAAALPLQKAGNITLAEDDLSHIEQYHGKQIKSLGFDDVLEYVRFVLNNVDAIYQGNSGRTFNIVTRQFTPRGRVVTRLEFEKDGDNYRIVTASPVRQGFFKNKTPLWERAHSAPFQKETPVATRRASRSGQSGDISTITPSGEDGNSGGETLFQAAMYRSPKQTMGEFVQGVLDTPKPPNKSFFQVPSVYNFHVPHDTVLHAQPKHSKDTRPLDIQDWENLSNILYAIKDENVRASKSGTTRYDGKAYLVKAEYEGVNYGLVYEVTGKDSRSILTTFFKGTPEAVNSWLEEKGKKETNRQGAFSFRLAHVSDKSGHDSLVGSTNNITPSGEDGNSGGETLTGEWWKQSLFQEANRKISAKIIDVDPSLIPVNLKNTAALRNWLLERFQGKEVEISSNGDLVVLTSRGLESGLKNRGQKQRQAYAELDKLLANSVYESFETADARHEKTLYGQNVYYAAMRIGSELFSVRFKVDMPKGGGLNYKGHKVNKIDIAPVPSATPVREGRSLPGINQSAISEINIDVLRGVVKPSRIENNVLYQQPATPSGEDGNSGGETLFQPLNHGVDLDATVPVIEVQPQFAGQNPLILRKRFPEELKQQVLAAFPVENEEQRVKIGATGNKFREFLKIDESQSEIVHLEALAVLPKLMRTARLVETTFDRENDKHIKHIHRYRAALRSGDKDYSVRLLVKQYHNGNLELESIESQQLYHIKLEKEMFAGNIRVPLPDRQHSDFPTNTIGNAATSVSETQGASGRQPSARPSEYSLRQLLEGVKDSEGNSYYQPATPGSARGKVKIHSEGYLVSLFKNADLSTLLHETGHIFFEEMERVIQVGAADETMRRDYATLRQWVGGEPGTPLTVEQKEQLARGFEAYLMEGKAPAEDLNSGFSRFRAWLLKIYRQAINLRVELNDEVRGVFDRMLATEKEIANTAASNELLDLTASELDSLGFSGTARDTAAGLMPKARTAAAESLQAARNQNRKQRLAKYGKEALTEMREEPVYRARGNMRKTPLDLQAVIENYGNEAADALLKRVPGGLRNDGGIDPEIFAAEHGFESGADMVSQMLAAPALKQALVQRVQEKETQHDLEYEAFEHLLETREVAVQMEMVGRKLAELLNVDHIERKAYMLAAQKELAAMALGRAMQTGNFLAAMRRALQQERRAINAGDRQAALTSHRKAMLNMEFVRLSRDIARRQGVLERRIKRFAGHGHGAGYFWPLLERGAGQAHGNIAAR